MPTYSDVETVDENGVSSTSFTITYSDDECWLDPVDLTADREDRGHMSVKAVRNQSGWLSYKSHAINFDEKATSDRIEEIKRELIADAESKLPPGAYYEIRGKIPENYGRGLGMAWISALFPDGSQLYFDESDLYERTVSSAGLNYDGGYIAIALLRTPLAGGQV